ncbi:MAG: GatB/YqeY domain-containing protein [Patescibacteria group bacterium]|jgi:hypothetical protein
MLLEKIDKDLIIALKSKDESTVSVLRMLKAAITNFKIAAQKELDDTDIATVLQKEIKTRQESAEVFKKGNRPELAEKEEKEIEILSQYLPKQASAEEIQAKAQDIIAKENFHGIENMGKVMGQLMVDFKGKADGRTVSRIVKEELTK